MCFLVIRMLPWHLHAKEECRRLELSYHRYCSVFNYRVRKHYRGIVGSHNDASVCVLFTRMLPGYLHAKEGRHRLELSDDSVFIHRTWKRYHRVVGS